MASVGMTMVSAEVSVRKDTSANIPERRPVTSAGTETVTPYSLVWTFAVCSMERMVPTVYPYAHSHFLPSYGATGGNAPGHLKSLLAGNHAVLPVMDGKLYCGRAQDIYFAEFDGVQSRKVFITVMGE